MTNLLSVVTTVLSVKPTPAGRRSAAVHGRFIGPADRFGSITEDASEPL
jgi:hypothetical protein